MLNNTDNTVKKKIHLKQKIKSRTVRPLPFVMFTYMYLLLNNGQHPNLNLATKKRQCLFGKAYLPYLAAFAVTCWRFPVNIDGNGSLALEGGSRSPERVAVSGVAKILAGLWDYSYQEFEYPARPACGRICTGWESGLTGREKRMVLPPNWAHSRAMTSERRRLVPPLPGHLETQQNTLFAHEMPPKSYKMLIYPALKDKTEVTVQI